MLSRAAEGVSFFISKAAELSNEVLCVLYLTRQKNSREHGEPFSSVPEDKWGNEIQNNLL